MRIVKVSLKLSFPRSAFENFKKQKGEEESEKLIKEFNQRQARSEEDILKTLIKSYLL